MSTVATPGPTPTAPAIATVADLLHQLGDIPPGRVLWDPRPGTATEADLIALVDGDDKRLVELVDGTLVEKAMGFYEARVGGLVFHFIEDFLEEHDLGVCFGADATLRVLPGIIRLPDVSFVSWRQLPDRELPPGAVANLIPELAVEVLSENNTPKEMERKRGEYFRSGTRLVWQIDPDTQSADVYTDPDHFTRVGPDGELDGGELLPGFRLPLRRLFARAGRRRGT